mmetsp:Transcript_23834/g.42204  ORF Transcript_23834/g.42204 Transcript_23834/m.42204 type:complete len:852 (+) Transcript_23834:5209-7764(+)
MNSKAILAAIERVVRAPIRFVCQVEHYFVEGEGASVKEDLLICLGEHEFFMMTTDMKTYRGEVSYPHILRVIRQQSGEIPADAILLELSEDRKDHIPARCIFVTPSKDKLLKHLKCYWQADYMFRLGTIRTLYVEEEKIDMRRHKSSLKTLDIPRPFLRPYQYHNSFVIGNYGFYKWATLDLKEPAYGGFKGPIQPEVNDASFVLNVSMNFFVEEERLVDAHQASLKYKADAAIEKMVGEADYWMELNEPYIKGCNLRQDISSWSGWWVKVKTGEETIIVIFMRRKYIPPLMESSQDIMISMRSDKDPEKFIRMTADSVYSNQLLVNPYEKVIQAKVNALLMSEETASFLQSIRPHGFRPEQTIEKWAFVFLYSLAFNIKNNSSGDCVAEMEKVMKLLDVHRYIAECKTGIDNTDFFEFIKKPMNAANKLCDLYTLPETEGESEENAKEAEKAIWDSKVARYLGYCVDGGLLFSRLVLADITGAVVSGAMNSIIAQDNIKQALNFMLNLRIDKKPCLISELPTVILAITTGTVDSSVVYVYNEKIMIAFMEQEYLQRELDFNGLSDKYYIFLNQLLRSGSIELKSAACREVIRISQGRSEESPLKCCIRSLLDLFSRNDYKLATLAAFALVNLSRSGKEIKEMIFERRDLLYERLKTKEQMLLAQTIKIFNNLVTNQTYRVSLKDTLPNAIIALLSPTSLSISNIPKPVVESCMELLSVLSKDAKIRNTILRTENFDSIIHLLKERDDCESQIVSLVSKICAKNLNARLKLIDECFAHFCLRLRKLNIFTAKQSGRQLLSLIIMLIENTPDLKQRFVDENITQTLHKIIESPTTEQSCRSLVNKLGLTISF